MNRRVAFRMFVGLSSALGCGGEGSESDEIDQLGGSAAVYALDVSVYTRMISWSEYECLWAEGVRHIIAGTQDPVVAAQQLDFGVASGMTVDLYVYLYWGRSITDQVLAALELAEGRPVGRLWLDVEEDPGGRSSSGLIALVREGLDACGTFPCGIYTGAGFWRTYMRDTDVFRDVPLWYARYDGPESLDNFEGERFGGWTSAVAKQYSGSVYVCGTGRWRLNVDENYWLSDAVPAVEVDRTFSPITSLPPAPTGLYPAGGVGLRQEYVKFMAQPIDGSLDYELEILYWNGSAFRPYHRVGALTKPTWLQFSMARNRTYRWRMRARNSHGLGAWSTWAQLNLGTVSAPPPLPETPVDPEPMPPPVEPPPPGVPSDLSPEDGALITTERVTLRCAPLDSAQNYEFQVQYQGSDGQFRDYYTYSATAPQRSFYPLRSYDRYRWRVRAQHAGAHTSWSSYATFDFAPR